MSEASDDTNNPSNACGLDTSCTKWLHMANISQKPPNVEALIRALLDSPIYVQKREPVLVHISAATRIDVRELRLLSM